MLPLIRTMEFHFAESLHPLVHQCPAVGRLTPLLLLLVVVVVVVAVLIGIKCLGLFDKNVIVVAAKRVQSRVHHFLGRDWTRSHSKSEPGFNRFPLVNVSIRRNHGFPTNPCIRQVTFERVGKQCRCCISEYSDAAIPCRRRGRR